MEWTEKVEIKMDEVSGSKQGMCGYIKYNVLPYPRLCREDL